MKIPVSSVVEKTQNFIHPEYYFIFAVVLGLGFLFYKVFLKQISQKRHGNLKTRFRTTLVYLILGSVFSCTNWLIVTFSPEDVLESSLLLKFYALFLISTLLVSAIAFVKLSQILAYLYLFFMNMRVGIPRLIANLFTFVLSLLVLIYLLSEVLEINLTAMIATSAVFSIVLGLALQDTLGNLFSGVAMQFGNPFSIGDWVEIQNGSNKWLGQVQEITWRATFITNFMNEWVMIPNKVMTQSQITIFSNNANQVRHVQTFRFEYGVDIEKAKKIIHDATLEVSDVVRNPAPRPLVIETTESWVTIKLFYSLHDFARKYIASDLVVEHILRALKKENIPLANSKIAYTQI